MTTPRSLRACCAQVMLSIFDCGATFAAAPRPLCGGVFVPRVNRAGTTCSGGERYVAALDLGALALAPEQEEASETRR